MSSSDPTVPFVCVTCAAQITAKPVFHVGLAFCCAGCVADGPCICSYDEDAGPIAADRRSVSGSREWPMTGAARAALLDEVARLRADVGLVADPVDAGRIARRLEVLGDVLEAARPSDAPDRAVIGRRATLLEDDGEAATYALVFPGDGDPAQGWISADSPLGAAVLDGRPGDRVEVHAPAGRRVVRILAIR